jgi:hypothetical protein
LVFSAEVQQLLDLGNDIPGFVLDLERERPLDLFLGIQSLLDFVICGSDRRKLADTVPRPGFLKRMLADLSQTS